MDASNISHTGLDGMNRNQEMSSNTQVLWGTNINTNDISTKLREFLISFQAEINDDDADLAANEMDRYAQKPFYIQKLQQIAETEEFTLDVDCDHLFQFNEQLYRQLEDYPTDVIPIFDLVALNVFKEYITS